MRLSTDHDGDDCIRIVVRLDKNYKEEDFLKGVVGLNGHVIDVLRDDLKHLFPYIRFKKVNSTTSPDPTSPKQSPRQPIRLLVRTAAHSRATGALRDRRIGGMSRHPVGCRSNFSVDPRPRPHYLGVAAPESRLRSP